MVKIAWGITGCGDKIEEIAALMIELKKQYGLNVDIYVSKNAVLMLKWYKLWDMLKDEFGDMQTEVNPTPRSWSASYRPATMICSWSHR